MHATRVSNVLPLSLRFLHSASRMIEPPKPSDAAAIERIASAAGVFTDDEVRTVSELLDVSLHPNGHEDYSFVVYRNGNPNDICGFACFGPTPLTDRVWDLYWICVDRMEQRSGIGSALLEQVESNLRERGARAIYLETSDSPEYCAARSFYERHGYECVAHLNDFYAEGEGKVMYRKVLKEKTARS
jgi:ribosomal protein S18 acetylase RimI-like enzyme